MQILTKYNSWIKKTINDFVDDQNRVLPSSPTAGPSSSLSIAAAASTTPANLTLSTPNILQDEESALKFCVVVVNDVARIRDKILRVFELDVVSKTSSECHEEMEGMFAGICNSSDSFACTYPFAQRQVC